MRQRMLLLCLCTLATLLTSATGSVQAAAPPSQATVISPLYRQLQPKTQLPWYDIAAVDRYETTIHQRKGKPGIPYIPEQLWFGAGNVLQSNQKTNMIELWHGVGKDADEDGIADPTNHSDALYSLAKMLTCYGVDRDSWRRALWDWYQDTVVVERITRFADIFQQYGTTSLSSTTFPLSRRFDYSFKETWGDSRGWGGRRMHEGTDLFASYGTPVLSCSYGFVETVGWNRYGGWRVGIRGINNTYYYYAHLSRFAKGLRYGNIVKPGDIVGFVGSSGYGTPGTSGKFPPHLHFGMYRDTGKAEWAFDPYPYLRRWERAKK